MSKLTNAEKEDILYEVDRNGQLLMYLSQGLKERNLDKTAIRIYLSLIVRNLDDLRDWYCQDEKVQSGQITRSA